MDSGGAISLRLPFGKETKWLVTYVEEGTGHLFCQIQEPSIVAMYEELDIQIEVAEKRPLGCPKIGQHILAKSEVQPGKWLRATVTQVSSSERECEVFAMDLGHSELMGWSAVSYIPPPLLPTCVPPRAHECILSGVESISAGRWDERVIHTIREIVDDQVLAGVPEFLHHRRIVVLRLYSGNSSNDPTVAEQLVAMGLARASSHQSSASSSRITSPHPSGPPSLVGPPPRQNGRTNSVTSSGSGSRRTASEEAGKKSSPPQRIASLLYTVGEFIDICVTFSDSPHRIYVQPMKFKEQLKAMQDRLQQVYASQVANNNNTLRITEHTSKNQLCAAKFEEDNEWYRGMIRARGELPHTWQVFFIDFGNTEMVTEENTCALHPDFLKLESMGLECRLFNVDPLEGHTSFPASTINWFQDRTLNRPLIGEIRTIEPTADGRSVMTVSIFDPDPSADKGESVNQELIRLGHGSARERITNGDINSVSSSSVHTSERGGQSHVRYVMPNIDIGLAQEVYVSFTVDPDHFYVQFSHSATQLDRVMEQIATVYEPMSANDHVIQRPEVGMPCAAQFSEDRQYYRGEITVVDDKAAQVHFVDYGNGESLPWSAVKVLRKEFIKLPRQAVSCQLNSIGPLNGSFSREACERFESLSMEGALRMTVTDVSSTNICSVSLVAEQAGSAVPRVDIGVTLLQAGLVCKRDVQVAEKLDYGREITRLSDAASSYIQMTIEVNSYLDVSPVHINSPKQFNCHIVQNVADFDSMTNELNAYYEKLTKEQPRSPNFKPTKDLPCVALYDVDDIWYRAIYDEAHSHDKASITFVDYGNRELVLRTNIFPICEYFLKLPAQAFVSSLADVKPVGGDWLAEANDMFHDLTLYKHLSAFIKSRDERNVYSVLLYDSSSSPQMNIGESLVKAGYASPTTIASDGKQDALGVSTYPSFNTQESGAVTAVENGGRFWVQLNTFSSDLNELMDKLDTAYTQVLKPEDCNMQEPSVGQFCCAQFTEDDGYYRAVIESVQAGGRVHVRYIDYGNSEEISMERIKILHSDFQAPHRFALLCSLHGVNTDASWDDSLTALLQDKECSIEFTGDSQPPFFVNLTSEGQSLNQLIIGRLALNAKPTPAVPQTQPPPTAQQPSAMPADACGDAPPPTYPPISLTRGEPMKGYVSHVRSNEHFCFQLNKFEADINDVMAALEQCGPSLPSLTTIQKDVACVTTFSEDGAYYRAALTQYNAQAGECDVQFVDYGNSERKSIAELRCLPPHLAMLPITTVLCSHSIKGRDLAPTAKTYLEGVSDEVLVLMPVGKKGGIYSVELMTEGGEALDPHLFVDAEPGSGICEAGQQRPAVPQPQPVQAQPTQHQAQMIQRAQSSQLTAPPQQPQPPASPSRSVKSNASDRSAASHVRSADRLPALVLPTGCKVTGLVSCVNEEGHFFVQLKDKLKVIEKVSDAIRKTASQLPVCSDFRRGTCCVVHMEEDREWYRAEVMREIEPGTIEVLFVDYGNTTITRCLDAKVLSADLRKEPKLSIHCCLDGRKRVNWNELEDGILDQEVAVEVISESKEVHSVKVYANGQLVNDSIAEAAEPPLKHVQTTTAAKIQPVDVTARKYTSYSYDTSSPIKMICSFVNSCTLLQLSFCALQDGLDSLMAEIETFIASSTCSALGSEQRNVGQPCLALYDEDGAWYRAEVIVEDDEQSSKCGVHFVDYGNDAMVDFTNLRLIPDGFLALPRACKSVVLDDVTADDLVVAVAEGWLRELSDGGAEFSVEVTEQLPDGSLRAYVSTPAAGVESINDQLYFQFSKEEAKEVVLVEEAVCVIDLRNVHRFQYSTTRQRQLHLEDLSGERPRPTYSREEPVESTPAPEVCVPGPPPAVESSPSYASHPFDPSSPVTMTCPFVNSASLIQLQFSELTSALDDLMGEIESFVNSSECGLLLSRDVSTGMACLAQYHVDEAWYRAEVITPNEETTSVHFIDYGNDETVEYANLRALPAKFTALPRTCISCVLDDVNASELDAVAAKLHLEEHVMNALALHVVVTAEIPAGGVRAYITIADIDSADSVNDTLYFNYALEEADPVDVGDQAVVAADELVITETLIETIVTEVCSEVNVAEVQSVLAEVPEIQANADSKFAQPSFSYTDHPVDLDNLPLHMTCPFVKSASLIQLNFVNLQADLDAMMVEIVEHIAGTVDESDQQYLCNLSARVGQPCLALYVEDGAWYRAEITFVDGQMIGVHFVDYGNDVQLDIVNLRVLPERFTQLPKACVPCVLDDVHVEDLDSAEAKCWLERAIMEPLPELHVYVTEQLSDGSVKAYVNVADEKESINDQLYSNFSLVAEIVEEVVEIPVVDCRLAESSHTIDSISSTSEVDVADEVNAVQQLKYKIHPFIEGTQIAAICPFVTSATLLQVSFSELQNDLDSIMGEIEAFVNTPDCAMLDQTEVGQPCLAFYAEDGAWYRAEVTTAAEHDSINVHFVDYGNDAGIEMRNLRAIPEQFVERLPKACVTCVLDDVHLEDIDQDCTKQWLEATVTIGDLIVDITGRDADDAMQAYVTIAGSDVSVNDEVYQRFALVEQLEATVGVSPRSDEEEFADAVEVQVEQLAELSVADESPKRIDNPTIQETEEVLCTFMRSATELKCQLLKYEDELAEVMAEIKEVAARSQPLQTISIEQLCIAKYAEDECWYRGEVLAFEDGMPLVDFLDYGNVEGIPLEDLRDMPLSACRIPKACVSCVLADVDTNADAIQQNIESVRELVEQKCLDQRLVMCVSCAGECGVEAFVYTAADDNTAAASDEISVNEQLLAMFSSGEATQYAVVNEECLKILEPSQKRPAVICQVDSASSIRCKLSDSAVMLTELMKIVIDSDELTQCLSPHTGQACMVELDGAWNRGRVLGTKLSPDEISVELIDCGITRSVAVERLMTSPVQLASLPPTCVEVVLRDVHAPDLDCTAAKTWLLERALGSQVTLEIVSVELSGCSVDAYVFFDGEETHLNDQLYERFEGFEEVGEGGNEPQESIEVSLAESEQSIETSQVETEESIDNTLDSTVKTFAQVSKPINETTAEDQPPILLENSYMPEDGDAKVVNAEEVDAVQITTAQDAVQITMALQGLTVAADEKTALVAVSSERKLIIDEAVTQREDETLMESYRAVLCKAFEENTLAATELVTCVCVETAIQLKCRLAKHENVDFSGLLTDERMKEVEVLREENCVSGHPCIALTNSDQEYCRAIIISIADGHATVELVDHGRMELVPLTNLREIWTDELLKPKTVITCILDQVYEADIDVEKTKQWLVETCTGAQLSLAVSAPGEASVEVATYAYLTMDQSDVSVNDLIYERFPGEDVEVEGVSVMSRSSSDGSPQKFALDDIAGSLMHDMVDLVFDSMDRREKLRYRLPVELSEGACMTVQCDNLESDRVTICHLIDDYEKKQAHIEELIMRKVETLPPLSATARQEDSCVASFHEDGCWYRGRLLARSERNGTADVLFVDYGNSDVVIFEDIRSPDDELAELPVVCFSCRIEGVTSKLLFTEDLVGLHLIVRILTVNADTHELVVEFLGVDDVETSSDIPVSKSELCSPQSTVTVPVTLTNGCISDS